MSIDITLRKREILSQVLVIWAWVAVTVAKFHVHLLLSNLLTDIMNPLQYMIFQYTNSRSPSGEGIEC